MKCAPHRVIRLKHMVDLAAGKGLFPLGLLLAALLCGCHTEYDYAWSEYEIAPERIAVSALPDGTAVALINDQDDIERQRLGGDWYASLRELTSAVITHLSRELDKRGATVDTGAEKVLRIAVQQQEFETGMWLVSTRMKVRVETGSGYVATFAITHRTAKADVAHGYNGAVALAVINLLNEPSIAEYLGP